MQIKELGMKKSSNRATPEMRAEEIKKMRKEHEKPIKGRFEFTDAQGGWLEFAYRFFKGEPITQIKIFHGEICELPLGVVRHLNNTKKKVRTMPNQIDPNARGVPSTFEVQSRITFIPVESL